MKKNCYVMLLLTGALFIPRTAVAQVTTVRLTVELPGVGIQNPKDSAVFVAGTFNGWDSADSCCLMKRIDSRHYTIEVPCFQNKKYEYKYTLGGWDKVEKKINDLEVDNRTFTAVKKLKIKDRIENWTRPNLSEQQENQGFCSPEQATALNALNDSLKTSLQSLPPHFIALMQKMIGNLMAEQPDEALTQQYNREGGELLNSVFATFTGFLQKVTQVFTPQQKQEIRKMLNSSSANGEDFLQVLSKVLSGNGK